MGILKKSGLVYFFLVFLTIPAISYGDTAQILPKGIFRLSASGKFYSSVDTRYDQDGNEESIAANLNAVMGPEVFPALSLVEQSFGMPSGTASLGASEVSFDYDFKIFEFQLQYGLTEKVSIGMKLPYWKVKNSVTAGLNTANATVGKTAQGTALGAPVAPLAGPFPDTQPLTTADAQNLIGAGLDTNGDGITDISGYGFKPVKDWSKTGVSDMEVGLKYQYYKSKDWRLAFTGGVRLPTGDVDDPDNLADYGFGTGAWALLFQFQNDYTGIKDVVLNATVKYDFYLPDKETLRVPESVDEPLTANKEKVDREYGDTVTLEAQALYHFYEGFSCSVFYQYMFAFKTKVDGDMSYNYSSLEDETDWTSHVGKITLSYSTLPLYRQKKFPLPITGTIAYRNRFAGKNNSLKSEYIELGVSLYF